MYFVFIRTETNVVKCIVNGMMRTLLPPIIIRRMECEAEIRGAPWTAICLFGNVCQALCWTVAMAANGFATHLASTTPATKLVVKFGVTDDKRNRKPHVDRPFSASPGEIVTQHSIFVVDL